MAKKYGALRNTMVVVAVLILSVTYQAAINPPGGTWPADDLEGHLAGTPVLRDRAGYSLDLYCFFNKLAFFFSMLIIIVCMYMKVVKAVRICRVLVIAAVLSMVATFITGALLIAWENKKLHPLLDEIIVLGVALTTVAIVFVLTAYRKNIKKLLDDTRLKISQTLQK